MKLIKSVYLLSILDTLNRDIIHLCDSNFLIKLSQIIKLWIDLMDSSVLKNKNDMAKVRNLIFKILDPCLFITNDIKNANNVIRYNHFNDKIKFSFI